ncbi:MAG: mitochondrial fission ELM1 family protein [Candidatus Omnitrophica bacterium]|nr:mitochondrial fission ELM1 family protein [Candidatus Omnitrophota bacterium]
MAQTRFTKDYAVYIGVRIVSFIVSSLPLSLALWTGRVLGLFMYHFHPKRKRIAYANLKAAFSKEKEPCELKSILRRTYQNYGQNIIEMLRIPRVDSDYLKRFITLAGRANFDEAEAKKRGIILLTSHFGNWELASLKSAVEGYPIYVLARPQNLERLNNLLNSYREKLGCRVINRGMPSREMIRALRDNKIVGILADQDVGKSGIFINLLGRPASHAIGPARLARDTNALILPIFIVREKGPKHLLYIEEPFAVSNTPDRNADIKEALEKHAGTLESYIKRYPDQWMWVYTRWKSTPKRRIVILSDGKPGHLNQSLAAFNIIKRCRRDSGCRDEDTSLEIIDVKFKNRISRIALWVSSLFASHACQGCAMRFKFAMREDSYNRLTKTYADIVISCGSSLGAVNIFLSKENNAKNVIIMKPGIGTLKDFDVAIIPAHDRPKEADNVVVTEGSPTLIDSKTMEDGARNIRHVANLTERKRLGLLIGGDNPEYSLSAWLAGELIKQVTGLIEERDMELLVTTSRRTPKKIEEMLKTGLRRNPRCKLLIIANEKNIDNAVGGILNLSEIVLVSAESISMVSEAASSGKKTIVFDLETKRPSFKHDYAIERLASENYITRTPVSRIRNTVLDLSNKGDSVKRLDNTERMYKKLYRII